MTVKVFYLGVLTGFPLYLFLLAFDSAQADKKSLHEKQTEMPLQSLSADGRA
jgi:hypothetical protein